MSSVLKNVDAFLCPECGTAHPFPKPPPGKPGVVIGWDLACKCGASWLVAVKGSRVLSVEKQRRRRKASA